MSGPYPFIDIAALDDIREGFVRGDAQIVLDHVLSGVLWANGAGAKLLGFDRIETLIGSEPQLPVAARRQIATASADAGAGPRSVSVRLETGLRSELTQLKISTITLPDGVIGLLLTSSTPATSTPNTQDDAVIAGLGDKETHVALLDADGNILASSPHFSSLDITATTLEDLVIEAADADDRLVKRRIRAGSHSVPGAVARLADTPPKHLLCIVAPAPALNSTPSVAADASLPEKPNRQSFRFDPASPPARFIWRTDADAVFSEISPEFAATVGPNAADVTGRRFGDVATVFGFDTEGTVAALLTKRDTWSGKRLMWPVEGTSLRVPVELAALPVYSRDRVFNGFRGFGLVRPEGAVEDPEQIGLALAGNNAPKQAPKPVITEETIEDGALALTQEVANDDSPEKITPPRSALSRESDAIASLLKACAQEKVASDEQKQKLRAREHRSEGGLTDTERNAFREIAERLRQQGFSATPAETVVEDQPAETITPDNVHFLAEDEQPEKETALLANLPLPVIIHSGDNVHYVNEALLDLTGYRNLEDIRDAGGIDALFNSESDDQQQTGNQGQGMILRRADGSEQAVDAHLNAIAWRGARALMLSLMPVAIPLAPNPVPALTAAQDEEKEALEAHVDELKTILDTATDGVVLIDPEGRIRSMNHSAAALFGYDREDTQGKVFSMLFAVESQRAAMDYLSGLSGNGVLSVLNDGREVMGREANGGVIPLFMTIGKLPQQRGFCAVLRDITQWKRTEEELTDARRQAEQASSQKTDFLARISHEIRTPLNAIIGFSELMSDEKFGPIGNERYRDYLRDINRSGNHVLALVNDLLDISKIEAGGLDMQFEAVSLNDAIGEAIALMQPQANRERIIIRSSFPTNLPDIVADARSIKQVALNLLSNAVRFTAPGGQVIISTSYELNGDVAMRVRDTGIGMTRGEIEEALKPFRQVNNLQRQASKQSRSENPRDWRSEGTGLGLPLTKAMVEANRAQFAIESTPGRGTMVEVIFPPTRVLAD
ncbi:PAS domain S-box protein [Brucella sp. BE17]|uniref:PAS domain S-box protein n=1 Tax=Brucella sp. BE17 TaxID=3142977 RepID=UPI0031BB7BDA